MEISVALAESSLFSLIFFSRRFANRIRSGYLSCVIMSCTSLERPERGKRRKSRLRTYLFSLSSDWSWALKKDGSEEEIRDGLVREICHYYRCQWRTSCHLITMSRVFEHEWQMKSISCGRSENAGRRRRWKWKRRRRNETMKKEKRRGRKRVFLGLCAARLISI